ncbi:MAG TPA: hypothetical protein V6D50_20510 [Chroococcales cyanobacterium]|jgi:hypothetical protein
MLIFDSNNWYKSNSSTASEASDNLSQTEKQLLLLPDFIEFPDWLSERYSIALDEGDLYDDKQQAKALTQQEENRVQPKTVLMTCPENMPRWEGAWWGEQALRALDESL